MNVRLYNISIKCVLAILLSALFASCKDEIEEDEFRPKRNAGPRIGFKSLDAGFQIPTTRAVIDNIRDLDNLYVLSMKNNGSGWGKVFQEDVLTLTNNGYTTNGEIWDYSPEANWENGYNYKFRAFYPMNFNEGAGESCANGFQHSAISTGSTVLTLNNYRSATDPRNNSDLLVSLPVERLYATDGNTDPVDLQMKHLLACVDFKFKAKEGQKVTITNFFVVGYASEGDCTIGETIKWKAKPDLSTTNGRDVLTIDVTYTGQGGQYIWVPELQQNVAYPPNVVLSSQNNVVFKDKETHDVISTNDLFNLDGGLGYLKQGSPKFGKFYVVPAQSGSLVKEGESSISSCDGLLFVPQKLYNGAVQTVDIKLNLTRADHGWSTNTINVAGISLNRSIYADIEFYFGDTDPGEGHRLYASVDLDANGKVEEWEAGKIYIYTIGMYEYQVNANIDIEDWTHHTFEGELK